MADYSVVGQSVYRTDANPKVTGRALHVGNIEMPGMLHVAVLRSPYPHARITRIEKSKAEKLDGVAVVLTGAEIAKMPGIDPHFGPAFRDQPILAVERVCYIGDPVVAVAAVDQAHGGRRACSSSRSITRHCPRCTMCSKRPKPGSALVHEQHRPAKAFADLAHVKAGQQSNVCYHFKLRTGDVDKAFAEADQNIRRHVQLAAGAACADGAARDVGVFRRARALEHLDRQSIAVLCQDGNFRDFRHSR